MTQQAKQSEDLWEGLARHGLVAEAFDWRGELQTDCPYCRQAGTMVLSKSTYRAKCGHCHVDARLAQLVDRLDEVDPYDPDVLMEPGLEAPARQQKSIEDLKAEDLTKEQAAAAKAAERRRREERRAAKKAQRQGRLGERVIMSVLALVFLAAGLAAAGLSGFANYAAFQASVSDPMQGRIWGWSGVIASICSFGGFTFFWWHANAKRYQEAIRSFIFAIAGAATSIAGTAMFMTQNDEGRRAEAAMAAQRVAVTEAQIEDWTRQLNGIPPETRSVEGLEQYLAGVELAGRTHQKPYRDAQNELGLAKRRDALVQQITTARQSLMAASGAAQASSDRAALPPLFFAIMLEVFSSQGTSIAFVTLLLLFGKERGTVRPMSISSAPQPVPGS